MSKRHWISIFLFFFLAGCGSSNKSIITSDYFEAKQVRSKYSDLSFNIPANWIEVSGKSASYFDICIVDPTYTFALYLLPMILDEESDLTISSNRLSHIAHFSRIMKEAEYKVKIDKETFKSDLILGQEFLTYNFLDKNNNEIFVTVFEHSSGPQELTFRAINSKNCKIGSNNKEIIKKIILSSIK